MANEMRPTFNQQGYTTLNGGHLLVEMTRAEALAIITALSYATAGDADDRRQAFLSEATARTGERVRARLLEAAGS